MCYIISPSPCMNIFKLEYCTAQNFGGRELWRFETVRKLVEKIFAANHTNNSSLFELTRTYKIWWIKLWRIANCLPNPSKFSHAKVLCHVVASV